MSDMLETFVKKEMAKQIKEKYPHVQHPSGMCARVIKTQESGKLFKYTLKILDKTMNDDNDFPEIPNVKSSIELQKDDIAVVILLYGGSGFFILGRYDP